MTSKGHGFIRGRRDLLYDPKGHGDLCGLFDLVYDPKRSRGHQRSPWPTLWPQRSRWPLWSIWPSLWPQKVTGSLEVAVTYFMTPKVNLTFDLDLDLGHDPKAHGVIRGRDDLLYDPKGQLELWPWPWPKGQALDLTGDHRCPGNTIMR